MQEHDTMSRIFRVALLIFATTFGIGLYALIGAPVLRINYGTIASKAGSAMASVGDAALKLVPSANLLQKRGAITYALTESANDLPNIRKIVLDDAFGSGATREFIFTKKDKRIDGGMLLEHFGNSILPAELKELFKDTRYFVRKDDEPRGTLFIATKSGEFTFPMMLAREPLLAPALLALTHPKLSPSEIRMLATLKFVSRTIYGLDARTITNSADEPILIWAVDGDMLIIAGNKESFILATKQ